MIGQIALRRRCICSFPPPWEQTLSAALDHPPVAGYLPWISMKFPPSLTGLLHNSLPSVILVQTVLKQSTLPQLPPWLTRAAILSSQLQSRSVRGLTHATPAVTSVSSIHLMQSQHFQEDSSGRRQWCQLRPWPRRVSLQPPLSEFLWSWTLRTGVLLPQPRCFPLA